MSSATAEARPRLYDFYLTELQSKLKEEFKYANPMEIPKVSKIVINVGAKEGQSDVKIFEQIQEEVTRITGQKPLVTRAKKSIAGFKLRQGSPIGLKVTLRGHRMYEFMDRLFNVAMPRIRDFRGFSPKSFDKQGNYTLGIQEQSIFPEVDFDKIKRVKGMDITFVTTAKTADESRKLLQLLGLPFRKPNA